MIRKISCRYMASNIRYKLGVDVSVHPSRCSRLVLLFLVYKPPPHQVRHYYRPEGRGYADVQAGEDWNTASGRTTGVSLVDNGSVRNSITVI